MGEHDPDADSGKGATHVRLGTFPPRASGGATREACTTRLSGLLAWVVVAVLNGGCSRESPGDSRRPIRFAYQDRVADTASILADRCGYFAREGLEVAVSRFSSGPACSEALYTGAADIATMGDTTAVIALARKLPVRVVASHGGGERRHRIAVRGNSDIRSVEQLAGKRMAVKKGTSTYGGLLAFLDAHGLRRDEVTIIDMRPGDMADALAAGSVDALVASEPTPSLAVSRGARVLADLGGLGYTYPILLVARTSFLEERPADVRTFLRAVARAATVIRSDPGKAADVLSAATGLSRDVADEAMAQHSFQFGLGPEIVESLRKTAAFLREQGMIESEPDFGAGLDVALAAEAAASAGR